MCRSYYAQEIQGPFETFNLGNFELESGDQIRDLKLAYATFGTLSPDRSNAVLFPTWYSGTSKSLEQAYVGVGRALDPTKYFIILVNQIGNGLSSAPSQEPQPFNGPRFPRISIADDVRAQQKLISKKFGIESLALVLGGSMGAQQTFEWAVRFPDQVKRIAPIAGTARVTPHNKLLVQTFIDAMTSDPAFEDGWYREGAVHRGLRRHARIFAASGFTSDLLNTAAWRDIGFTSLDDFVAGFVENHFLPQDPNNLILLLQKWQGGDVSRIAGGDLKAALARIKAKAAVIAIEEDLFFPLKDIAAEQKLIPNSTLKHVSSPWGHLSLFGADANYNAAVDQHLKDLLASS
jgi:homoserine O-acetyltransferase/O-succinyltransferase